MRDLMVQPNAQQTIRLEQLRSFVLWKMAEIHDFQTSRYATLEKIPLGVLRKNATQKHGVTRWRQHTHHLSIEGIELHPELLNEEWQEYAKFVLYHEFLHGIGFKHHDAIFRHLESRWPLKNRKKVGRKFTVFLQRKNASWQWVCSNCDILIFRKKPSRGKYICKSCKTVLVDEPLYS
jgi:predicted SprT family Zn-dependent metalloprotease